MGRKFNCPYCQVRLERPQLIKHVDAVHTDMLAQGYSGARVVYDIVNNIKTGCGSCRVCHKPTKWNETSCKYDVLCDNPACKEALRELYKRNMLRVRGTYNILNDPEQQKLMLSHRKISGVYRHTDGGTIQYTGDYERKFLEFIDNFLQIPSKDILSPGPTIEYEYNGSKHVYLPDFYYIPFNLIIEIKDGGDNVNTRQSPSMKVWREKTIEKERLITDKGVYNYLRLTNNQFEQLIDIFMAIKEALMNGEDVKTVRIHEDAGLELPSHDLPGEPYSADAIQQAPELPAAPNMAASDADSDEMDSAMFQDVNDDLAERLDSDPAITNQDIRDSQSE